MGLMPKRVKHRKEQKGVIRGNATRGNTVSFGEYGLQSLQRGWISARQIEAGRVAATHFMAGEGKLWIRIFPHKPVSKKPAETRMGKGKGEVELWVACVKPGTILYEVGGLPETVAKDALVRTAHKLPVKVRFVSRRQAI
ncbi:MAG TPA: 50S ribosomal protein L16 [Planctomycetota bacterium]|nr:50S ribosomal protein L16 [Planctomycetota bacterium]